MKIWNVLVSIVVDGEEFNFSATPFLTSDEAMKYKSKIVNDERIYTAKRGYTIDCDTENSFIAYLEGYYCTDHTKVQVVEQEI